jgi:threonine synthase
MRVLKSLVYFISSSPSSTCHSTRSLARATRSIPFQFQQFSTTMSEENPSKILKTDLESKLASYDVPREMLHESVLDCFGRTPIIKLNKMSPQKDVNVYIKLEAGNPGGSIKDRLAYGTLRLLDRAMRF